MLDSPLLQAHMMSLYVYALKWGRKINVDKTKVCGFEEKKINGNTIFYINNELVELVDNFTYFNYNGNLYSAVKVLHDQALSAYRSQLLLFIFLYKISLDVKSKLSLLYSMLVVPIYSQVLRCV